MMIRPEQVAILDAAMQQSFIRSVLLHIEEFFPERCRELGPQARHELVQLGIRTASRYNVKTAREICKYVDLMLCYGTRFDKDPWAAKILNDAEITDGIARINRLLAVSKSTRPTGQAT